MFKIAIIFFTFEILYLTSKNRNMDFAYEEISKYVLDYQIDGNRVVVEFQNDAGEVFDSSAIIKRAKTITSQVTKKVGRMAKSQARRHASRMVRSALGGGMLGRIGSQVARSSVGSIGTPGAENHTTEDINEAIAKSFRRVSRNFKINSTNQRVSGREKRNANSDRRGQQEERSMSRVKELSFQDHLSKYPIKNLFEQDIMSRLLVAIAQADGRVTDEERNFITELLPKKIGSISDIAERGAISSVEAEELDGNVKKSIMLLAWAVALVDFDLSPAESRKLNEFSSLFGFDHTEVTTIANLAKYETMTSVMDPLMAKDALYDAAAGIGLTEHEAERMLIQFKKSVTY